MNIRNCVTGALHSWTTIFNIDGEAVGNVETNIEWLEGNKMLIVMKEMKK